MNDHWIEIMLTAGQHHPMQSAILLTIAKTATTGGWRSNMPFSHQLLGALL